ncbi:MAG: DegV family protein [Lachnospiraceae bacterium]|nr:DegV family protein [Lachnospiraceae bacterium]
MAIRFVVDSASDIHPSEAETLGLYYAPMLVSFNDEEFYDAVEISHTQFYEKLIESDVLPTTSQITPSRFEEIFKEITDNGDIAIVITLSSFLSGTYQSACVAASEFEGKVFVVDSLTVTVGERILVMRGLELRDKGLSAQEIVDTLNVEKEHIMTMGVLDTLEYLKKGGRISAATAFAGSVLSIKPVVAVVGGVVEMVGKARGSKNSENLLRKKIEESGGVDFERPFCLAYSGLSDVMLKKYIEDSADLWKDHVDELQVSTVGSIIGTHVGPGAIAVAYFANN